MDFSYLKKSLPYLAAIAAIAGIAIATGVVCPPWAKFMKCNPPADVDKNHQNDENACWKATAANMLAGAGYGETMVPGTPENDIQYRANQIYAQMLLLFTGDEVGWAERAINKWIESAYNTWPDNHYKPTITYGIPTPAEDARAMHLKPWPDTTGPQRIANHLRHCDFVALYISWAIGPGQTGYGHWITCWGDERCKSFQTSNPKTIRVTDSDSEKDGDVQIYSYDDPNYPNPGGDNVGFGWYFDYESDYLGESDYGHPFIRQALIFMRTNQTTLASHVPISASSYRPHLRKDLEAIALHYELSTDADILNLVTVIEEAEFGKYEAQDLKEQQRHYIRDWDLKKNPLPLDQTVTITTELALPNQTGMSYKNVNFTSANDGAKIVLPDIGWSIVPEEIPREKIERSALGGYVIGSFDVFAESGNPMKQKPVAQIRLIHQYAYFQSPSIHKFKVWGTYGFYIANIRFGHSYGYLDGAALWDFGEWTSSIRIGPHDLDYKPFEAEIDFGPMPYPLIVASPVAQLKQ